jgi:AcrR family transcriptional regulator
MAVAANKVGKRASGLRGRGAAREVRVPQQSRAHETVDALLTATKTLLIRGGVEAATTNAVARLAGVSIGSLYQYFPSREALIAELSRRHVAEVLRLIFGEMEALLDTSIHVGARRLIRLMLQVHRKDPEFHAAIEASHPGLAARAQLAQVESQVMSVARAYLEHHRDELVVADLDRATFIVVTTVEALTHDACLKRPEWLDDEGFIDDVSRMILGYLTGR